MPYIIESSTPRYAPQFGRKVPHLTHYAVATLEEARKYVAERGGYADTDMNDFASRVATAGDGTSIGPLPNGTVIEVASVEWPEIAKHISPHIIGPKAILDAYNAR